MKTLTKKKQTAKPKPALRNGIDTHCWATKMEIKHLISGKPDLKVKAKSSS